MSTTDRSFAARLGRVVRRGPRYLVWRAAESARRRARRPWSYLYPRLLTDRALLAALGADDIDRLWEALASQAFFISSSEKTKVAERFVHEYPDAAAPLTQAADAVMRHEFDLLGSGPRQLGTPLPWHTDFKTGRQWPLAYCTDIEYNELDRPSDVKVPWELSRCQHFTRLGQAYWITGDERYAAEFVTETSDWIAANPFSHGVNWACAMDVALRAVSWIWGFIFQRLARAPTPVPAPLPPRAVSSRSLHRQASRRKDLNGNHYLATASGWYFSLLLPARVPGRLAGSRPVDRRR